MGCEIFPPTCSSCGEGTSKRESPQHGVAISSLNLWGLTGGPTICNQTQVCLEAWEAGGGGWVRPAVHQSSLPITDIWPFVTYKVATSHDPLILIAPTVAGNTFPNRKWRKKFLSASRKPTHLILAKDKTKRKNVIYIFRWRNQVTVSHHYSVYILLESVGWPEYSCPPRPLNGIQKGQRWTPGPFCALKLHFLPLAACWGLNKHELAP